MIERRSKQHHNRTSQFKALTRMPAIARTDRLAVIILELIAQRALFQEKVKDSGLMVLRPYAGCLVSLRHWVQCASKEGPNESF